MTISKRVVRYGQSVSSANAFPITNASANNEERVVFIASRIVAGHLHCYACKDQTSTIQFLRLAIRRSATVIESNRKRIIVTLLLSIVILGQAFGGASAAAQRRRYRVRNRANGALIGNIVGLNRRRRGPIHRQVLIIPTRRRLPRTPIIRRVPTIPVTRLRNRRY